VAKQDFPSNIERRRLLVSVAALAAFRIASDGKCAKDASLTTAARPPSSAPGVQGLNVCAATAHRLLEIEQRNLLRAEANLPLLSIPKELRRMKQQEVSKEFERFAADRTKSVWEEVLKPRRDASGNPNWRPNNLEGMCLQNRVRNILWEQFLPGTSKRVADFVAGALK
jgi:hypothetical protein